MLSLYINGVAYNYPEPDEPPGWGDDATAWAVAVTQNLIPKNGGLFNLFGDVNFGSSNGLIAHYFKSDSLEPLGSVGVVRLAYEDVLSFRNATDTGDILVGVNADGNLTVNGSPVGLPNPGPAGTYLYSDGTDVTWKQINFSELSGNITSAQMNGGVGATSGTFFAGDNTWKAVGFDMLSGNIAVSQINSGFGASASTYLAGDGTWKSFPGSNTQVLFRGGTNGLTTDSGFTYASTILTVGNLAVNGAAGRVSSTSGGLQLYSPSSQSLVLRAGVTNTSGPFPSTLNGQVLIEGNDVDIWSNTTMNIDALNMRLGAADIDFNAGQVDIQGDYGAKKVTVDSNGIGLTFDGKPLLINGSAGTSTWVLTSNGAGAAPSWQEVSATGVIPGSNTQVLFNDGGVLGADADFTYNKTTNVLTVPTLNLAAGGTLTINGSVGANNTFLRSNGLNASWSTINISTNTTGTLPIERGGTGQVNASAALNALLPVQTGSANRSLVSNGTSASWSQVSLSAGVVGTLPVTNGGTGVTTLTGYVKGNGTLPLTASATIPASDVSAGGVTGSIQYNNGSTITGSENFTYSTAGQVTLTPSSLGSFAVFRAGPANPMLVQAGSRNLGDPGSSAGSLYLHGGNIGLSTGGAPGSVYLRGGINRGTSPSPPGSVVIEVPAAIGTEAFTNIVSFDGLTKAWQIGASLDPGTAGQVLTSNGNAEPEWSDISAPEVYSQATEPTGGISEGDIWFNTTTYNMYVYVGSAWVLQGQDDGFF